MNNTSSDHKLTRLNYISTLNDRVKHLNIERVNEYKKAALDSYQTATIIPKVSVLKITAPDESNSYRSIGLRQLLDMNKFNDPTYSWLMYFKQIGRVIADGEQRYFQQIIGQHVRSHGKTMSHLEPDFSVLNKTISNMQNSNVTPDTVILPISLHANFFKHYFHYMDFRSGHTDIFNISDTKLRVISSNKRAELRSIILFNSKAGIWKAMMDLNTDSTLTTAIGESITHPGQVEYWVETRAQYRITDYRYFSRIRLSYG